MTLATYTPAAGGFDDRGLAAFLASVPAATDYDLNELLQGPRMPRRLPRAEADAQAIAESIEDAS